MNRNTLFLVGTISLLIVATGCAAVAEQPAVSVVSEPLEPAPAEDETVSEAPVQDAGTEVEPPASDDDGLSAFSAPVTAVGDILIVTGRLLDVNGDPLPGAAIEFWQTDESGVYDHPGDPGTNSRDTSFQFYGTSIADADGQYVFRTILPGRYEPRPRHIHVKVKLNGTELLTTQFYFVEDGTTGGVGGGIDNLLLTLEQASTSDGLPVNVATFDVVVNTGLGAGALSLTDSQGEGPYYPLTDVSNFDNDLASLEG